MSGGTATGSCGLLKRASPVFPQVIVATCLPGYALNETAHDDNKYDVKCHADASFEYSHHTIGKSSFCLPICCGVLPEISNGRNEGSSLFGEQSKVSCDDGFPIDQSASATKAP